MVQLESQAPMRTAVYCINSLPTGYFSCFLSSADCSKSTFLKNSFRNTIRVSNSLDPDQARQKVGPDLGPNCLLRLSADDTRKQRVKQYIINW